MKKRDFGQTISVLANVGVIAGIVFLAVEIRQNSEALGVQATQNRQNVRRSIMARPVDNPELGRILYKAQNGEDLTSFERYTFDQEMLFRIINWEMIFYDVEAGLLDESQIPLDGWRNTYRWPGVSEVWERYSRDGPGGQNQEFVAFVNENVIDP